MRKKKHYVLKDYWTHKGRKRTEKEILLKIKGLLGVSQLVEAWTVQTEGADETTDWLRPPFLVGNKDFETRLHRRLLLTPVGDPLVEFSSLQELISIFIDIVHGEQLLSILYQMLISPYQCTLFLWTLAIFSCLSAILHGLPRRTINRNRNTSSRAKNFTVASSSTSITPICSMRGSRGYRAVIAP